MAKRRRLGPVPAGPQPAGPEADAMKYHSMSTPPAAPIAQVTGASAAAAAFEEVSGALASARAEGRLIQRLALDAIDAGWLVRDRLAADGEAEALDSLVASIRARGQQTPVEVVALDDGRHGLISGWRRLTALQRLHAETGEARFASVLAILRAPASAAEAYVAMVEENEIRLGLSYYERARIVARAAEQGVFDDEGAALRGLFGTASRARRSKIGAFLTVVHALDGKLRFPAAIPERLGLALARALEAERGFAARLTDRLRKAAPDEAAAELALLARALEDLEDGAGDDGAGARAGAGEAAPPAPEAPAAGFAAKPVSAAPAPEPAPDETIAPGLRLGALGAGPDGGRLVLTGPAVDAGLRARLAAWLAAEG